MTETSVALEAAAGALEYVERLLDASGLPTGDVREKPECFYVGSIGGDRVGIGGIERRGADGLLRSVVVEPSQRGRGVGTVLVERLEGKARADGIDRLYLLTTTAADFFGARGYVEAERSDVPAAIRATTQFEDLCPASATCMRKEL